MSKLAIHACLPRRGTLKPPTIRPIPAALLAVVLTLGAAGCDLQQTAAQVAATAVPTQAGLPRPDHVVVVVEENHAYSEIIDSGAAPYINSLAAQGALFTNSHATGHPSQPNYLDLFSGSNQGVTSDSCPHTFSTPNLGSGLSLLGFTFAGYSEDLPGPGSTVCRSGGYARKHAPWVNFDNVPASANQPFSAFPSDYGALPTVSFVIPNLHDEMHDGSIAQADSWLRHNIDGYVQWERTHNSLLVLTWDEDDRSAQNRVVTIFVGPMVAQGQYAQSINHFNVLRTLEDMYGLAHAGASGNYQSITGVWAGQAPKTPTATSGTAQVLYVIFPLWVPRPE